MERFEYIVCVWCRPKEKYVHLGISLSDTYDGCLRIFNDYRDEWQEAMPVYDFDDYHIRSRKVVYTDWEVIYE